MAPDLSERLLGVDIEEADDGSSPDAADSDEPSEELEQFLFAKIGDQQFALPVDAVRTLAEVPDELTRVPRSPEAVLGMMDLRGEITAVIDPHVHFPNLDAGEQSGRERLLVLDRSADQQSAAVQIDSVLGVETVAVSNIHDDSTISDRPFSGDSLTHPLVDALIEQQHESDTETGTSSSQSGFQLGGRTSPLGIESESPSPQDESQPDLGETFELEADEPEESASPAEETSSVQAVVIEVTPLIAVERLLLASGPHDPSDSS